MRKAEAIEQVTRALAACIPDLDWRESGGGDTNGSVLTASVPGGTMAFEIDALDGQRVHELLRRLSQGALRAKPEVVHQDDVPVVVIVTERIGAEALAKATAFMQEYSPEMGWGVVDLAGTVHLVVPALGLSFHHLAD